MRGGLITKWLNNGEKPLSTRTVATTLNAAEGELQTGRWPAARKMAIPFLQDREHGLRARSIVANAAMQMKDYKEAALQFRFLMGVLPSNVEIRNALSIALNNLGSVAWNDGLVSDAERHYREALEVSPKNPLAWFNLAACAKARNAFAEASRAYARCLELDPSRQDARLQWAICERGRFAPDLAKAVLDGFDEAHLSARLAISVSAEWTLLGDADAAARVYARAANAGDIDAASLLHIARTQLQSGDVGPARSNSRKAIARATDGPTRLRASLLAALGLPAIPDDRREIEAARNVFSNGIRTLDAGWPGERLCAERLSLDDLAHSHYLLAYQGENDLALAKAFGRWYGNAAMAVATSRPGSDDLMPGKVHPRRIALVSARWNMGTITAYFGSWIEALANAGWEVHIYHIGSNTDNWTTQVARSATKFHHLPGPLTDTVSSIRKTGPAILIYPEVGLDPRIHVLAALRLAPKQAAAWGHPVSTGLASIDAFFSCSEMEPAEASEHYSEQLLLLPYLGTYYRRPSPAASIGHSALGLPESGTLYLAPHAPVKTQAEYDALLAGIASRDRQAKLVMFRDRVPALTAKLVKRMTTCFDQHGIDLEKHLVLLPRMQVSEFRSVMKASNILLDATGFSGGNTSLDAVGQGLPLVTLAGESMRSRQSAAMLQMCGLGELVASTPEGFIDIACRLGSDIDHASYVKQKLHETAQTLFEDHRPLETLVELVETL